MVVLRKILRAFYFFAKDEIILHRGLEIKVLEDLEINT